MDPKKQDLNPELKQIYDRVMNTQAPNAPVTPLPSREAGSSFAGQVPFQPAPAQAIPQPAQPAAPQPISEPKAFVFTGNKIMTPQGETHTSNVITSKKGLSGSIIAVLVVILVIAWGALWAKIFGLF